MKSDTKEKHKKIVKDVEKNLKGLQKKQKEKKSKANKKKGIKKLIPCFFKILTHNPINILGIILIIIGIVIILNPENLNLKISFTIIYIGFLLIILITKTDTPKRINGSWIKRYSNILKKTKLLMSEKITLVIIIWTLILFFLTNNTDVEVFFVLIFIGLLVIKLLTDEFTSIHLKNRLNIFIFVFLVVFLIIISQRILT